MPTRKRYLALILITSLLFFSCNRATEYQQNQGKIFGTLYHVTYQHNENLGESIHNKLLSIDASLSVFNDTSTISKINTNQSDQTDYLFNQVFNKSREIYHATNGAFDPTISPLINAWGFGFKNIDNVTPTLINSLLQTVGMNQITLTNNTIEKVNPNTTLNFSAIAKGYACDLIAQLLQSQGIENYLVEIGGEVIANGTNPTGEPWRIGINTPEIGSTEVETILHLTNGAVATSGNYRNFYIQDGKRISHTINPRTGYPTENNLLSATVIAEDCTTADAYATAFMVLGVERSLELANSTPNLETLLIYSTTDNPHAQLHSTGLHNYLH
ncbi:MAG: FAD:protein FMN transferase [Bacteroidales bacterium]